MGADVNAFIDKIIKDAEDKVRADLKNISAKAKNDFIGKAQETVNAYYANYSPKIYIRTNNLRSGVIDTELSFSVLNGNGYGAWIQFNSDNMGDYDDGDKNIVVANFMKGIHGRPSIAVEANPASKLMDEFQDGYKKILDGYFISLGYKVN